MRLAKIASVQMGYPFRSRLERSELGSVSVIQMKDVSETNHIEMEGLARIDMPGVKEHHLVRAGDLVFRSRGNVTTSAVVQQEPGMTVIAAPLLRIRVVSERILPVYLNWFINQSTAQNYLARHARGTSVSMINKRAVEEMEIAVPPLERQQRIIELAELAAREQQLLRRLAEKRSSYISRLLMQLALE